MGVGTIKMRRLAARGQSYHTSNRLGRYEPDVAIALRVAPSLTPLGWRSYSTGAPPGGMTQATTLNPPMQYNESRNNAVETALAETRVQMQTLTALVEDLRRQLDDRTNGRQSD